MTKTGDLFTGQSKQTVTSQSPPPRFPVRPTVRSGHKLTTTPTPYEKDAKALEKSGIQQENIIWIASGSVGGFVILLTIFVLVLIRRRQDRRMREFMEDNPIYGHDYYYNPIKANEEKVEYFDVTESNVEKQNSIT